jgi:hypothetical protein
MGVPSIPLRHHRRFEVGPQGFSLSEPPGSSVLYSPCERRSQTLHGQIGLSCESLNEVSRRLGPRQSGTLTRPE